MGDRNSQTAQAASSQLRTDRDTAVLRDVWRATAHDVFAARVDLGNWTCDWACDAFGELMRDASGGLGLETPIAPSSLLAGDGWAFENHELESELRNDGADSDEVAAAVLIGTLLEPATLRAATVGMSINVPQITLRRASHEDATNDVGIRYFSARLCKTSVSKAMLVLTNITALVTRHARAVQATTRTTDEKRDAARACEAHSRSFVFHEIGNLSTGLYGVLDECREAAKLRTTPPRAALESFDILLASMHDVLQNMSGVSQLTSGNVNLPVHFASEVRRAQRIMQLAHFEDSL